MEPYHLIGPVLAAITAISLGGMALVCVRMWVSRNRGLNANEMADLREQLREDVRDEVSLALEGHATDVEELHERIDFAERLLTQGQPPKDPEAG